MEFQIRKSTKPGKFYFRIVAQNGNILASSEVYSSKRAAQNAIASIRKSAATAEVKET